MNATIATPVPRFAACYLGVVQFFFATTWTLYVIYLPQLARQAGIDAAWVPWILVADQIVFALMDVVTGFWVDRVRRGLARFGAWILALTLVSGAAFLMLPFAGAQAGLLLAALLVWALTSSALRSPPWALLSRYAAAPAVPWLSALVLTGSAVAAALSPYLGVALRGVDARLPFALSTLTLVAAVAGLVYVERRLARSASPAAPPAGEMEAPFDLESPGAKRELALFCLALLVMAIAFQVHFALNSASQYLRFAAREDLQYLMPVFWIGFNLFMFPAAAWVKRQGALLVMAAGGALGAVATLAAVLAPGLDWLISAQFIAGGAWGAVSVAAFSAAMAYGRRNREGALLGTLFSMLALATFARIAAFASGATQHPAFSGLLAWVPLAGWLLGALLLCAAMAATRRHRAQGAT